jgi:hypothetical protein
MLACDEAQLAEMRREMEGVIAFVPSDEQLRRVWERHYDIVCEAARWGWGDTVVRDDLAAALEAMEAERVSGAGVSAQLELEQGEIMDDGRARRIAAEWQGPASRALSAFATSGAISRGCAEEIQAEIDGLGDERAANRAELRELLAYVERLGPRGPVDGWHEVWEGWGDLARRGRKVGIAVVEWPSPVRPVWPPIDQARQD